MNNKTNQCPGCQKGLPKQGEFHIYTHKSGSRSYVGCTKARYEQPTETVGYMHVGPTCCKDCGMEGVNQREHECKQKEKCIQCKMENNKGVCDRKNCSNYPEKPSDTIKNHIHDIFSSLSPKPTTQEWIKNFEETNPRAFLNNGKLYFFQDDVNNFIESAISQAEERGYTKGTHARELYKVGFQDGEERGKQQRIGETEFNFQSGYGKGVEISDTKWQEKIQKEIDSWQIISSETSDVVRGILENLLNNEISQECSHDYDKNSHTCKICNKHDGYSRPCGFKYCKCNE